MVSPVIQALRTSKASDQKTFEIVEEILRSVDAKSEESDETECSDADDEDDEFKTSNKTILPYVQAELVVPNLPSKTVMLFLDSGSASTFIDQKLADKYNLPISYRKNITFNAFGEKDLEPATYNAYEFNLLKNDGTQMQIIAFGVERLTSITVAFPNLVDKDLQSEVMEYDYTSYFRPDILIGANYVWEILSPNMEKLPSGLYKIDTIFGSCLTGCGKVRRESPDPDDPITKLFNKLWDEAKTDADGSSNAHPKTKKLENRTRMKRRTRFRVGLHRRNRKHKHRHKRT